MWVLHLDRASNAPGGRRGHDQSNQKLFIVPDVCTIVGSNPPKPLAKRTSTIAGPCSAIDHDPFAR